MHKSFVLPIFLGFLFIFSNPLQAQKAKPADFGIRSSKALKYYFEGRQQDQWRDYYKAISAYKSAIEIEPDFVHAHMGLGANYYVTQDFEQALPHLKKVTEIDAEAFPVSGFYLAESYFFTESYAEAIEPFSDFLEKGKGLKKYIQTAELHLKKALFAASAIQDSVKFKPENLGPNINSIEDDYIPYLTADNGSLLFTSKRKESTGGFNHYLKGYAEDFYISSFEEGKWQKAENLGFPINTEFNEGAPCMTQDGKVIYYTACNYPDGLGNCDIYFSIREGNRWTKPQNLGPNVNSPAWDSQPCLSHDGKTLYFSSRRPGGFGREDIYVCKKVNGEWTPAVNIGDQINTVGNEGTPFLHADGLSLYFYSDFHPGFGRQDLFVCYKSEGDTWSEPKNLGYPLNTSAHEANIFVDTKGNRAYINSNREGGMGKSDIYTFELDERIRPKIATFLRGITRDSLTRAAVYSHIRLIDVESGDTIREMRSGKSDGKFLMSLPLNREYAAHVEASGYLFSSKNFYLKDVEEDTYFDLVIELNKIKRGKEVVLRNIFFESGSFELLETSETELGFLLYFLNQNPSIRVEIQGHTDDVGSETDNLTLSKNRAASVKSYLESKGIDASRIESIGFGEKVPISSNETEEGRAKNRRTTFKILDF